MMPIHIQHVPEKLELIIFPSQKPPVTCQVNIRDVSDARLARRLGHRLARPQQNGRRGQQFRAHRPIRLAITGSIRALRRRRRRA